MCSLMYIPIPERDRIPFSHPYHPSKTNSSAAQERRYGVVYACHLHGAHPFSVSICADGMKTGEQWTITVLPETVEFQPVGKVEILPKNWGFPPFSVCLRNYKRKI